MTMIRVLIVDDSAVVRMILREHLEHTPGFQVIGIARNGMDALKAIEDDQAGGRRIDAVILDDVMPVMTGKELLKVIKGRFSRLAVVLFSANVGEGAEGTLDALFHGADDALKKPSQATGGMDVTLRELDDKLRAAVRRHASFTPSGPARPEPRAHRRPPPTRPRLAEVSAPTVATPAGRTASPVAGVARRGKKYLALVIGSSTGGPEALTGALEVLPATLSVPVFVVQHMPADFTARLAERLDRTCRLTVSEARAGTRPRPGTVYIAPGDFHMTIRPSGAGFEIALDQGPRVHSCRPAADNLFLSAAAAFKSALLCTVLTGMGSDGLDGAHAIKAAGGDIVVQDEDTSVVWGMPGYIARAGIADAILPIGAIGNELLARVGAVQSFGRPRAAATTEVAG